MTSPLGYDGNLTATLSVSDLDRSIAWFSEMLGFELAYKIEDMGWCELKTEIAGVNVGLSVTEEIRRGGGATLVFGVKDVVAARRRLEEHDVLFDGEVQEIPGMVSLATFFDPDGNQLMLAEDLADGDQ